MRVGFEHPLYLAALLPGWIENLYVRTDGVRVERKDDLADYFSPDVLWAQQEYIASLEDDELASFGGSPPPSTPPLRRPWCTTASRRSSTSARTPP